MIKSNSKLKNALTAGVLGQKTIKSVKLIGVTNQVVDTKLHAFLNWQEHIQANVYSFFVRYTDGTSRTVETYDQDEVSYYMSFVEREEKRVNKSKETFDRDEVFNQLTQLVNLKDRNVISDEVFERERNLLLAKLDESVSDEDTDKGYNLWIHRTKKRSAGNAKEHLILDGVKRKEIDLDSDVYLTLENGVHTIQFYRIAYYSDKYEIEINSKDSAYEVEFACNMVFRINVYELED